MTVDLLWMITKVMHLFPTITGTPLKNNSTDDQTDICDNNFGQTRHNQRTETYHFYNVLWIERENNIAYRRAAGRVPKAIWEKNCTGPMKVILG
jgi:hypothetical protein